MRILSMWAGTVSLALLVSACGGGGGSSASPAAPTLSGLAATGAALGNKAISIKCSGGQQFSGTTDVNGSFSFDVTGAGFPCLAEVNAGGTIGLLHGFATATGNVNVTPVTELIVTKALGGTPTLAGFDSTKANTINGNLESAKAAVVNDLGFIVGGWTPGGNPLTMVFAVGDREDAMLDRLQAVLSQGNKTLGDLRTATAAGGLPSGSGLTQPPAEEARGQDSKAYTVNNADLTATTFSALASSADDVITVANTERFAGKLASYDNNTNSPWAAYRIEVPPNWNGKLVMYAHGYPGEGNTLSANNAAIRRYLINNGFAWAASGYSKNSYDVRAGIEDTNKLANSFAAITTKAAPTRIYIIGESMGGHIAAAAVEEETIATAKNKVNYAGSLPMCGVMGDTKLFDTMAAMGMAALNLSGIEAVLAGAPYNLDATTRYKTLMDPGYLTGTPLQGLSQKAAVNATLFTNFPSAGFTPKGANGAKYWNEIKYLTGGDRPLFDFGMAYGGSYSAGPNSFFGLDATLLGIATKYNGNTNGFTYQDATLNSTVGRLSPGTYSSGNSYWNRPRTDGLRWVPQVNGRPAAKVVTLHTLGDIFVPFSMQQIYRDRLTASGATYANRVVQRAIRGATHCDFTNKEKSDAFAALVAWVEQGTTPSGDDVKTTATVAAATYGCTFTNNTVFNDVDEPLASSTTRQLRQAIVGNSLGCP